MIKEKISCSICKSENIYVVYENKTYVTCRDCGHKLFVGYMDGKKISQWTCGVNPEQIKIIKHRAIYIWRFE